MARSAEDCALLLSAMSGPDLDRDSTSLDRPAEDYQRASLATTASRACALACPLSSLAKA